MGGGATLHLQGSALGWVTFSKRAAAPKRLGGPLTRGLNPFLTERYTRLRWTLGSPWGVLNTLGPICVERILLRAETVGSTFHSNVLLLKRQRHPPLSTQGGTVKRGSWKILPPTKSPVCETRDELPQFLGKPPILTNNLGETPR